MTPVSPITVPDGTSAHDRIRIARVLAPFPEASPLWTAGVIVSIIAPNILSTIRTNPQQSPHPLVLAGLEQEVRWRWARIFPDTHLHTAGFGPNALYHSLVWQKGTDIKSAQSLFQDVVEIWGRARYVAPDGRVHTRPAKGRVAIAFNHRLQFSYRNF